MTSANPNHRSSDKDSWDAYWKGTAEAEAWSVGGARHPAVSGFWGEFLTASSERFEMPSIVDIGSGNGTLMEYVSAVFGERVSEIHCVDSSESAIASIGVRFPQVIGHVADARSIPLASGKFDMVVSQFGVEYAGLEAFNEAARLLAESGRMAVLAHSSEGQIFRQNETSLEAVRRARNSAFIDHAHRMFVAGFAALRGEDRLPYEQAGKQLAPAIEEIESIMTDYGEEVADGTMAALYQGVASIHGRIQHYEPDDVMSWLTQMNSELETYEQRMVSMHRAAIDETGFLRLCQGLENQGLTLVEKGPLLTVDTKTRLAWAIIAKR